LVMLVRIRELLLSLRVVIIAKNQIWRLLGKLSGFRVLTKGSRSRGWGSKGRWMCFLSIKGARCLVTMLGIVEGVGSIRGVLYSIISHRLRRK
jgi:hypothetical protein